MTRKEVVQMLAEALEVEASRLEAATRIEAIEEWTSIGWLSIMAMVDERLSVQLTAKEIRTFKTVADVVNQIGSKVALEG